MKAGQSENVVAKAIGFVQPYGINTQRFCNLNKHHYTRTICRIKTAGQKKEAQ